jgi:hypothetical protein
LKCCYLRYSTDKQPAQYPVGIPVVRLPEPVTCIQGFRQISRQDLATCLGRWGLRRKCQNRPFECCCFSHAVHKQPAQHPVGILVVRLPEPVTCKQGLAGQMGYQGLATCWVDGAQQWDFGIGFLCAAVSVIPLTSGPRSTQ